MIKADKKKRPGYSLLWAAAKDRLLRKKAQPFKTSGGKVAPAKKKRKPRKPQCPFKPGDMVSINLKAVGSLHVTIDEFRSRDSFRVERSTPAHVTEGLRWMVELEGIESFVPHEYLTLVEPPVKLDPTPVSQTTRVARRRHLNL